MDSNGKVLLSVPEVAKRIGVSRSRTWELIYDGSIQSVKIGRLRKVRVSDLEKYVEALVA